MPQSNLICSCQYNEKWYRGRIVNVLANGMLDVWLVDVGKNVNVNWRCLRILDNQFLNKSEAVILCGLSDVAPISKSGVWNAEAIDEFRRLSLNSNLRIFVGRYMDRRFEVCLYVKKPNAELCINGLLVNKKLARSTGIDSEFGRLDIDNELCVEEKKVSIKPTKPTSSSVRMMVDILNVISPSEFYVSIAKQAPNLNRLHHEIQNTMANFVSKNNYIWNANDNCFVRALVSSSTKKWWYRGHILEIINEQKCVVFIQDHGQKVTVSMSKLAPIDPIVANLCNGAFECHLSNVQPTGASNDWALASIDHFKMAVAKFDAIGITFPGERKGNSIPVILWGMLNDARDPLAPTFCEWTNINKVLVSRGYAHLTEKFQPLVEMRAMEKNFSREFADLDNWLNEKVNLLDKVFSQNDSHDIGTVCDVELNTDVLPISEWTPPMRIKKTLFNAIPTYVDNNGVIYMHEVSNAKFLQEIQHVINRRYNAHTAEIQPTYLAIGQPCLAKFSDDQFYRALVLAKLPNNNYKVSPYIIAV